MWKSPEFIVRCHGIATWWCFHRISHYGRLILYIRLQIILHHTKYKWAVIRCSKTCLRTIGFECSVVEAMDTKTLLPNSIHLIQPTSLDQDLCQQLYHLIFELNKVFRTHTMPIKIYSSNHFHHSDKTASIRHRKMKNDKAQRNRTIFVLLIENRNEWNFDRIISGFSKTDLTCILFVITKTRTKVIPMLGSGSLDWNLFLEKSFWHQNTSHSKILSCLVSNYEKYDRKC